MALSNYAKSLGLKSKKDVKSMAPEGAQWGTFDGEVFYKIEDGKVFVRHTGLFPDCQWISSCMEPDLLTESHFFRLGKK